MEKLLLEACLDAMATGAVAGIQDMGAAGLTCSTCEMGSRAGTGIDFDLALVPQREVGMTPYEIMLSESQERMLLVAHAGREEEVLNVFRRWGLDAVIIGRVTADGMLRVRDHGVVVAEIPSRQLADEAPLYNRPYTTPLRAAPLAAPAFFPGDLNADLLTLAASGDLCDKSWIWEQYDYTVRTNTIAGPGLDAAIVRVKETDTSIAMSLDGNGRYSLLDPRQAARLLVAECCRNLACVGAVPIGTTNCLNFGNPERPEIMAQAVETIEGMAEACAFFDAPVTGGNVSLYNETLRDPVFPSPVFGIVGLMKTTLPPGIGFRNPDREIVLVGGIGAADEIRMGGTQYAKQVLKHMWGLPPFIDLEFEKRVQNAAREIVVAGLAETAHDLSEGGLAWALAESTFKNGIGAAIHLESDLRPELLLFHEGPSRVLISTANLAAVQQICESHGVPAPVIGRTGSPRLTIENRGVVLIHARVFEIRETWSTALESALHVEAHV
jgi:phosphoribosylformylglycinamidine synthase